MRKLSGAPCHCSESIDILNCFATARNASRRDQRRSPQHFRALPAPPMAPGLSAQPLEAQQKRATHPPEPKQITTVEGGLWPISRKLHLWSLTSASRGAAFLSQWLDHYARLGVQHANNTHINVQEDFANDDVLHDLRAVVAAHGVRDVTFRQRMDASSLEGVKLKLLNACIRALPRGAYLIAADGDEFFSYPCDILQHFSRLKDRFGRPSYAACAFMQDRISHDLRLRRVQMQPPIDEQFGRCAKIRALRGGLVNGNLLKISLIAARPYGALPTFTSAHRADVTVRDPMFNDGRNHTVSMGGVPQGPGGNFCVFTGRFPHYSMTFETQILARQKIKDGYEPDRYATVSNLVQNCGNNLEDCYMLNSRARSHVNRANITCEGALPSCPATTKLARSVRDGFAATRATLHPRQSHAATNRSFSTTDSVDEAGICSSGPLHSIAKRVHLWSMLAPLARPGMLPHWLAHYRAQGVRGRNMHLVLDVESKHELDDQLNETRATVSRFGIADVQVVHSVADSNGDYELVKLRTLNAMILTLPKDALLIYADGDEFFEFPCNAVRQLMSSPSHHAICGRMMERLPAWGTPAPSLEVSSAPDPSEISRLFPICSRIRRNVQHAAAAKLMLVRVHAAGAPVRFTTAHIATAGKLTFGSHLGPRNCIDAGYFGHYAISEGAAKLAMRKAQAFTESTAIDAYMRTSTSELMTKFASMLESVNTTRGHESVRLNRAGAMLVNRSGGAHTCPEYSTPCMCSSNDRQPKQLLAKAA